MKRIFINTPYPSDANSFWRCMGPMSYLAKHSDEYSIHVPVPGATFQWDGIAQYDMIFMHRPCRPDDLKLVQMAKLMNIPIWSDYDDWLFSLPEWNPHCEAYHHTTVQTIMATAIACSDLVTVSTALLQKEFSKLNDNVVICPNAYRDDLFPFRKDTPPPRKEMYTWRGTNTHDGDLISVIDAFSSLEYPGRFMGSPSYMVTSQMKPALVSKQPHIDTIRYWKMLYETAAKAMLFPLDGHYFNQCKSNIAWIEATHAGSVTVAPNFPEWKHPGVIHYEANRQESFLAAAETAMSMTEEQVREMNQEAFIYMKAKYGIATVNKIRVALLDAVLSPEFKRNTRDPFEQMTGLWALSILKGETLPRVGQ